MYIHNVDGQHILFPIKIVLPLMEELTRKKLSVSNFQTCYQQYGQVEPKENTKLNETKLTE